jgi:signal peptidase I
MNNNFTEWLVNLSWLQMLAIVLMLLVFRYLLLRRKSKITKSLADTAEMLATAGGLIFLVIFPFLVQPFFIPSESMVPTFQEDDRIFVNKAVYRMREPHRGDIVVFDAPPSAVEMSAPIGIPMKDMRFVKRIIAVPGDEIRVVPGYLEMDGMRLDHSELRRLLADSTSVSDTCVKLAKDGVYVNGKRLTEAEVASRLSTRARITIQPGYVILNGQQLDEPYAHEDPEVAYPDLDDLRCWDAVKEADAQGRLTLIRNGETVSVKLGSGQYMVMGDNRNHSLDSRFWGPLDRKRMLGRAMFVWWPFARLHWAR